MTDADAKIEKIRKRIERRENMIAAEMEKLKQDKAELARAKSDAVSEYMLKENLEFNDDFKRSKGLAARILASGISGDEINAFFSLADEKVKSTENAAEDPPATSPSPTTTTMSNSEEDKEDA